MKRKSKLIAWLMVLVFTTTLLPVAALPVTAADPSPPVFTAGFSDWAGGTARAGDSVFYIEAVGSIADGYKMTLGTWSGTPADWAVTVDPAAYTQVASQTGHWNLGRDKDGQERHIYQLTMDGGQALEESVNNVYVQYYPCLTNDDGSTYYGPPAPNESGYYGLNAYTRSIYIDSAQLPAEISTATTSIPYTCQLDLGNLAASGVAFSLWKGVAGEYVTDLVSQVGVSAGSPTMVNLGNGRWEFSGNFTLSGLTAGSILYLRVSHPGADEPADSSNTMTAASVCTRVLGDAHAGQFSLSGAVAGKISAYGGHGHGGGSSYEQADSTVTFYLGGGLGDTVHTFTLSSPLLADASKLTVEGGTLVAGSIAVELQYGIYTVTGGITIPASSTGLTFKYNGSTVHTVPLDRTALQPGAAPYATGCKALEVDASGSITIELSGFNLSTTPSDYSLEANEWNEATQEYVIKSIAATRLTERNGVLTITFAPYTPPYGGRTRLGVIYNGVDPFYLCGYDIVDATDWENPIYGAILDGGGTCGCTVMFEADDRASAGSATPVLLGIVGKQSLTLYGVGFTAGTQYTAYFMEHTPSGLGAEPAALTAQYKSADELSIEDTSSLARGWYEVYLKADGVQISGFAQAVIREGSAIVNPTVKLNGGAASTTDPAIAIAITPGTFTQVRLAESESDLASAVWQDILSPMAYTLSAGYGSKTLYFAFRDDAGNSYRTSAAIAYISTAGLPAPTAFGVAGETGDPLSLYLDTDYTMYLKYAGSGYVGTIQVLGTNGDVLETYTARRTATEDGLGVYTVSGSFTNDARSLRFFLADSYGSATAPAVLDITMSDQPVITRAVTPQFEKRPAYDYDANTNYYSLTPGSTLSFRFDGTPGKTATAIIETTGGLMQTVTLADTSGSGAYAGTGTLPTGAAALTKVTYRLSDNNARESKKEYTYTTPEHRVVPSLTFTGGDKYNGSSIHLDARSYDRRSLSSGSAEFLNLANGGYPFTIIGSLGLPLVKSSATIASSNNTTVDLAGAEFPEVCRLAFALRKPDGVDCSGMRINLSYDLGGGSTYSAAVAPGQEVPVPAGTAISYSLAIPYYLERSVKPAAGSVTAAAGSKTETIDLQTYEKYTLTGTVLDDVNGNAITYGSVYAEQQVAFGASTYNTYESASIGADGSYELELYRDAAATITYQASGYRTLTVDRAAVSASEVTLNQSLPYDTNNKVVVNFLVYPLKEAGAADPEPVAGDVWSLYLDSVTKVGGATLSDAYFTADYTPKGYRPYVRLANANATAPTYANERLTFNFSVSDYSRYVLDTDAASLSATMDSNSNGAITVTARQKGVIQAQSLPGAGSDAAAPSYMLIFDAEGNRVGDPISGSYLLTTEGRSLAPGNYTVFVLRGQGLSRLGSIKLLAALQHLIANGFLQDGYYTRADNVTLAHGIVTDLGVCSPASDVTNDMLGSIEMQITAALAPAWNGNMNVDARISTASPEVRITKITFSRANNPISSPANAYYLDGMKCESATGVVEGLTRNPYRAAFVLGPDDENNPKTARGSIAVTYNTGSGELTETFAISENVNLVTLEAPGTVDGAEQARKVQLHGFATNGKKVEIYDGESKIGETTAASNNRYSLTVCLLNPERSGSHSLQAKCQGLASESRDCQVFEKRSYISDFELVHHNGWTRRDHGLKLDNLAQINTAALQSLTYYPSSPTTVSFKINGFTKSQIDTVWLVNTNKGVEKVFPATCTSSDAFSSVWKIERAKLSYIGRLSIRYDLRSGDPELAALLSGSPLLDLQELMDTDPQDAAELLDEKLVLPEIRNASAGTFTITNPTPSTQNRFELVQEVTDSAGNSLGTIRNTVTQLPSKTVAQLQSEGYRGINTAQGTIWYKQSATDGAGTFSFNRQVYFAPAIANSIGLTANSPVVRSVDSYGLMASAAFTSMPLLRAAGVTDATLTGLEWGGYMTEAANLISKAKDLGDKAYVSTKFVNGMNALNAVGTVVKIASGPSTKSADPLIKALANIENQNTRATLRGEITDYVDLCSRIYKTDCFSSSLMTGMGFAANTPITKGAMIIGGMANSAIGSATISEMDAMWDSIALSIQLELAREMRKRLNDEEDDDGPGKEDEIPEFPVYIDPSGYVFEAVDNNRVAGVTATVYEEGFGGVFIPWTDAVSDQPNPQPTSYEGRYGWDVPAGGWKVGFTDNANRYQPAETKSMTVPPAHTQVNIGLLATAVPTVQAAAITGNQLEIGFDSYMQQDSIDDSTASVHNITVYDSRGNIVPGAVTFPEPVSNTGYAAAGANAAYQQDIIASTTFVKRALFTPDASYVGGFREFKEDGETPETYQVVVSKNVLSYSGVAMAGDYRDGSLTKQARRTLDAPTPDKASGRYSDAIEVTLTAETGADIYYTTDGSEPTYLSYHYNGPIPLAEDTTLKFFATKAGCDDSAVVTAVYYFGPTPPPGPGPGPGSNSSGGGGGSPSLTIPVTGEGTVKVTATVSGTKATIGLTDSQLGTVLGSGTDEVTIDVLTLNQVTEVIIPDQVIDQIAASGDVALTVKTATATVTLDAETLKTTAAVDGDLRLVVDKVELNRLSAAQQAQIRADAIVFDLQLWKGNVQMSDFDGTGTVCIPYGGEPVEGMIVWRMTVDSAGNIDLKPIAVTIDRANQCYVFVTDGFSLYVLAYFPFTDVDGDKWYYENVVYAFVNDLFKGTGETTFAPEITMSRAMLVTVLWRMEGEPAAVASDFTDLTQNWYIDAVSWAAAQGIVQGYSETEFGPDDTVTREQMAAILYRYEQMKGGGFTGSWYFPLNFADAAEVSAWADEAMHWCVMNNLIQGSDGQLMPQGSAQRCQIAAILHRFCERP